uniref:uncharacterized protein n=1 Tax=Myxine glutinosa TaxID=7769 RepID=UPI00358EF188
MCANVFGRQVCDQVCERNECTEVCKERRVQCNEFEKCNGFEKGNGFGRCDSFGESVANVEAVLLVDSMGLAHRPRYIFLNGLFPCSVWARYVFPTGLTLHCIKRGGAAELMSRVAAPCLRLLTGFRHLRPLRAGGVANVGRRGTHSTLLLLLLLLLLRPPSSCFDPVLLLAVPRCCWGEGRRLNEQVCASHRATSCAAAKGAAKGPQATNRTRQAAIDAGPSIASQKQPSILKPYLPAISPVGFPIEYLWCDLVNVGGVGPIGDPVTVAVDHPLGPK